MYSQQGFVGGFGGHNGFVIVQTRQHRICNNCLTNVANPGKDKCQTCYNTHIQRQQQQQNKRCNCCFTNYANPGKDKCQTCYNLYKQQKRQQQFIPPSPSPYANYASPTNKRVCCNSCGNMPLSGTLCCGRYRY